MVLPHYDFKSFRTICGTDSRHKDIQIHPKALQDAQKYKLTSKKDILYCIDEKECKDFIIDNSCFHKKIVDVGIMIDSYIFQIDKQDCYLAFFFDPRERKWFIKSFHPPERGTAEVTNALTKALEGVILK